MYSQIVQGSLTLVSVHFPSVSDLGEYLPLCGNDWDIAVLNLSVISYGRQFDRLGVLLFVDLADNRVSG